MLTPAKSVKDPTAVQDLGDGHETASSWLVLALAGVGVRWRAQLRPSHRSASVAPPADPTAVHAIVSGHDTPTSTPPTGFGVRWIRHLAPRHRSAKVPTRSARLVKNPTAVQDLRDTHDTPSSPLLLAPAGLGVGSIDQAMSERCAMVTSTSAPLVKNPTAVQDLVEGHDTPANWPYVAPAGFGVR
jgi:hypothetical protein